MKITCYLILASLATFPAVTMADTPPKSQDKPGVQSEKAPAKPSDTSKGEAVPVTPKTGPPNDLDAFFKEGQEQADKG